MSNFLIDIEEELVSGVEGTFAAAITGVEIIERDASARSGRFWTWLAVTYTIVGGEQDGVVINNNYDTIIAERIIEQDPEAIRTVNEDEESSEFGNVITYGFGDIIKQITNRQIFEALDRVRVVLEVAPSGGRKLRFGPEDFLGKLVSITTTINDPDSDDEIPHHTYTRVESVEEHPTLAGEMWDGYVAPVEDEF